MNNTKKLSLSVVQDELSISEMVEIQAGSGCGQAVADCMGYIYNGMGWWSVATWIGTAFCPAVAVGAAADCAVHNC